MKTLVMILLLIATGCATTHPGRQGKYLSGDKDMEISISANSVDGGKDSAFELFEVTLENKTDDWLRINNTRLVIADGSKVSVVVGHDLKSWAEAKDLKNKMDQHNKEVAIATTQMTGVVIAAAGGRSSSPALGTAGAVITLGGLAWAVGDVISATRANAMGVKKVPESHIYESFTVPGKMFTRKWILINKSSKEFLTNLVFEFETVSGEKSYYEVKL